MELEGIHALPASYPPVHERGRLGADGPMVGHESHTRRLQHLLGNVQGRLCVQGVRVEQVHL
jgi:hypothetical protein